MNSRKNFSKKTKSTEKLFMIYSLCMEQATWSSEIIIDVYSFTYLL